MISADDLRYFLAVAQRRRLVGAGRLLAVDHTTVGRRIAALERSLGQRLFDRTVDGWQLTDAGRRLVPAAESVAATLLDVEESLGAWGLSGTLRITAPDGFGALLVAPALRGLKLRHPDLVIELVTATQHLPQTVREFDVAVTLEKPTSPQVVSRKLSDYVLRLYASRDYLAEHRPIRVLDDLRSHPLVWYVEQLLDLSPLRTLSELLPVPATVQSTNVFAQWQAAAAGVGVAVLPQFVAAGDPRLCVVLPELEFSRSFWLVVAREHARFGRVAAVTGAIEEAVASAQRRLNGPPDPAMLPGPVRPARPAREER
ncbi:MAG: LysR family transcriptional regulator [Actinomycetota bacterium]|nr:LysR family transcriptional regulator [Actinomycetota bacterium]